MKGDAATDTAPASGPDHIYPFEAGMAFSAAAHLRPNAAALVHRLMLLRPRLRAAVEHFPALVGLAVVLVVAAVLGLLSARVGAPSILIALGVLALGVAAVDLALIPVLAVPMSLVSLRAGGILSYADLALAAASFVALFLLRRRGAAALQPLLWAGVGYLGVIIPTLILNHFSANYIEWAHEVVLVLGSLIVGFVVGREGKAGVALGLYVLACSVLGIATVFVALQGFASSGQFSPAYVGIFSKNAIGGSLAMALVIAFARPAWLHWRPWFSNLMVVCCVAGIIAAQSRQGIVAAIAGLVIVALRPVARKGPRGRLVLLVAIPVMVLVYQQVLAQLDSGNPFNSANQRLLWYQQAIDIWKTSPVFGVGLRWWYTSTFGASFQPPNAEVEVLSCVGVVGLLGFLAMFAVSSRALMRIDPVYGTLGLAVVLTRFVQAQFDLYWVSGQASFLWIVAGACVGVMVRERVLAGDPGRPGPRAGGAAALMRGVRHG